MFIIPKVKTVIFDGLFILNVYVKIRVKIMERKPLTLYSDKELEEVLVNRAEYVEHSYNSIISEIDRRRLQKNADRVYRLSILAIIISVTSLTVSALVALFK